VVAHAGVAAAVRTHRGLSAAQRGEALTKGLTFRPLAVTAEDTLDWHKTRPPEVQAATLEERSTGCR
jgi:hypothetical protein